MKSIYSYQNGSNIFNNSWNIRNETFWIGPLRPHLWWSFQNQNDFSVNHSYFIKRSWDNFFRNFFGNSFLQCPFAKLEKDIHLRNIFDFIVFKNFQNWLDWSINSHSAWWRKTAKKTPPLSIGCFEKKGVLEKSIFRRNCGSERENQSEDNMFSQDKLPFSHDRLTSKSSLPAFSPGRMGIYRPIQSILKIFEDNEIKYISEMNILLEVSISHFFFSQVFHFLRWFLCSFANGHWRKEFPKKFRKKLSQLLLMKYEWFTLKSFWFLGFQYFTNREFDHFFCSDFEKIITNNS